MNYGMILYTLGRVLVLEGFAMLPSVICSVLYGEPLTAFMISIAICLAAGAAMSLRKPKSKPIYAKEGSIIVAVSWVLISVFGALPFVFSGNIPNFWQAMFETASGFTTTGASVVSDIEAFPKGLIFWRSFTHWIGGMGVLVFLVAILPSTGGSQMYLIKAESPGPAVSKLVPKVRTTAKLLYIMYIVLTLVQIVLMLFGGNTLFDSLTLTFGTAGTGGFAIRNSGLADYSSYTQVVVTVFMLLFGVDFSVYYLLLMRRFSDAFRSDEVRAYFGIVAAAIVVICINCRGLFENIFVSLKHSAFQVASVITTTGYATTDFDRWPELSKTILILLMFIGACAGSTGGGMKVSRILILLKTIVKEIKIGAHPKSTVKISMNGRPIEHETVRAVNVYVAAYFAVFVVSALLISIDNLDFNTNFTAIAATLNNIGPGMGKVGPMCNFSVYSDFSLFVMTLDMLIGRLEIFPMLILFSPYTWRK